MSRVICCLRCGRTYICGICQYAPAICGIKWYICAGIGNNGSYCCLKMGIWSGVLLTWLVLTSLFASCARSLITTETITTELSPCVTITESLHHSERGRGMRWWLLWWSVHLGYGVCPVFLSLFTLEVYHYESDYDQTRFLCACMCGMRVRYPF